jgi:Mrp family chromosome partitioning ATPase
MSNIMRRLSEHFDWIVIDTPPVIPLTDAALLSRLVDASLLVVRADRTPKDAVDRALAILGTKHVVGVVLNAAEDLNRQYYGYGYYLQK